MGRTREALSAADIDGLDWGKGDGLIVAVVQDAATLQVLMVGYMNREALAETLESGEVTFHSRSRGGRWRKGETSGNTLRLDRLFGDCDGDALLVLAHPAGPTCHEGTPSCFSTADAPGVGRLGRLERTIAERAEADPSESWTAKLLSQGAKRAAQKVGEEGVETALAGAAGDVAELCEESADLLYHLLVLLRARDVRLADVLKVLERRA
jgi:phosphoribosyl-ATP pyrophosphohydrolase/phosphoribosyl-AMP cyclohydrolase